MHHAREQLEPTALKESFIEGEPPSPHEIELSKAISLKRIADALNDPRVAGSLHFTLSRMLDTMDRPL